jgi:hypothetical protein
VSLDFEAALVGVETRRREFLHRLVAESAFTAPDVSSFTMAGVSRAYAGIIASVGTNTTVQ